jgi:hypothetical protein
MNWIKMLGLSSEAEAKDFLVQVLSRPDEVLGIKLEAKRNTFCEDSAISFCA